MITSEKDPKAETNENVNTVQEHQNPESENSENSERRNESSEEITPEEKGEFVDYEKLAREDMKELISLFPYLSEKESIYELSNPLRYAALRDLGLSPKEAYLATCEPVVRYDNRSHLRSAVPRAAGAASDMLGAKELEAARELFSGLSDREIQKLYKKVSK